MVLLARLYRKRSLASTLESKTWGGTDTKSGTVVDALSEEAKAAAAAAAAAPADKGGKKGAPAKAPASAATGKKGAPAADAGLAAPVDLPPEVLVVSIRFLLF